MHDIVLVTNTLDRGGTDRVAIHLANGFARSGLSVSLLIMNNRAAPGMREMIDPAVSVTFIAKRSFGRALNQIAYFPRFAAEVRKSRPQALIATGNNNAWLTALGHLFRARKDTRLHIKVTNPIVRPHDGPVMRMWRFAGYGIFFRIADQILALSLAEANVLAIQFPSMALKFRAVINPYVTPEMLRASPDRARISPSQPRIVLAIGRLHHQKNFPLLLRAWANVEYDGVVLSILGEGSDRAELETLADELGITHKLRFEGFQADVQTWLERADLFVLSSNYEGLPAVVFEAMATGCPIVTTDCFPAARELVGTAPGCRVVVPNQVESLAQAISQGLAQPAFAADLKSISGRYTIEAAIASHLQLLNCNAT